MLTFQVKQSVFLIPTPHATMNSTVFPLALTEVITVAVCQERGKKQNPKSGKLVVLLHTMFLKVSKLE